VVDGSYLGLGQIHASHLVDEISAKFGNVINASQLLRNHESNSYCPFEINEIQGFCRR
jgi:hypothetical protein